MTTSFEWSLSPGSIVQGRWNRNSYQVERQLGEGANGKVYLVRRNKSLYALKIGFDPLDHQSEVNALKTISGSSTSFNGFLLESDNFTREGQDVSFCVIRYIRGKSISEYLKQHGRDWLPLIGLHLLRKLNELHSQGFVFGDLKPENVLVCDYGSVELIDFGGVTAKGRSVKQFTEVFDRGFWNAGSRSADEAYDLFAFAVLLLSAADRQRRLQGFKTMLPQNRNPETLLDMLKSAQELEPVAPVLRRALQGQYSSSKQALADWRARSMLKPPKTAAPTGGRWLKLCFAASLVLFGATLYLYWQ
ncbi:serine/threonine protein kinase [Paenibacillus filicis]|uniref:non-specific serine/threonine protein kinase n=1 Tax=Paenibacillus gyeongsangnamensis TaxID=3388067 RepID=A0ABT4QL34_9BACL|nr:serine/threonine protein kinase [Paenibacillus filicis]MCZ8517584.1 serine/threonine protein kinase [Paenibacillus filicis]